MKKPFTEWFEAQYGKRPSTKTLHTLRNEWINSSNAAARARQAYDDTMKWEHELSVALKAWQAWKATL